MGLGKTMQTIALLIAVTEACVSSHRAVREQLPAHLRPTGQQGQRYICRKTAKQQEQDGERLDNKIIVADEAHNLKKSTSMHNINDSQLHQDDLLDSVCFPETVPSLMCEPLGELMRQVDIKDVELSEKLAAVRDGLLEAWTGRITQASVMMSFQICCEGRIELVDGLRRVGFGSIFFTGSISASSETAQDS
ncbi:hypothetical protein LTR27_006398 [Elasticomyces elasticus]|nr:hypothetical protein LTR27_006398 [Elasticomyces elasticus]